MKSKKKNLQPAVKPQEAGEKFPSSQFSKDQRSDAEKGLKTDTHVSEAEGHQKRSK